MITFRPGGKTPVAEAAHARQEQAGRADVDTPEAGKDCYPQRHCHRQQPWRLQGGQPHHFVPQQGVWGQQQRPTDAEQQQGD